MNLSDASGYQGKMLAVGAHRFNVSRGNDRPLAFTIWHDRTNPTHYTPLPGSGEKKVVAATIAFARGRC